MAFEFTPTREYLPQYYAQCADMIQICDALDKLYFRPYYTDVCLKTQVYGLFRNDLATDELYDTVCEHAVCAALGIAGTWAQQYSQLGVEFRDDWSQRRICAWLLFAQVQRAYTRARVTQFVEEIERLLHCYARPEKWIRVRQDGPGKKNRIILAQPEFETGGLWTSTELYADVVDDIQRVIERLVPINIHVDRYTYRIDEK